MSKIVCLHHSNKEFFFWCRIAICKDLQHSPRINQNAPQADSASISPGANAFTPSWKSSQPSSPIIQNRFNSNNRFNYNRTTSFNAQTSSQQGGSFSLFVKGDGISEEYLKQTFVRHVANIATPSVEMKNKYRTILLLIKRQIITWKAITTIIRSSSYAFVIVENRQIADECIRTVSCDLTLEKEDYCFNWAFNPTDQIILGILFS